MYQMLYANQRGEIFEHPELGMSGRSGGNFCEPQNKELIPLPEGASLTLIPEGVPVGIDGQGRFVFEADDPYRQGKIWAVGALLPQGYTRTLLPAYQRKSTRPLPLLGYTAVGWSKGKFYVAAIKTDEPYKWDPLNYNTPDLAMLVANKTKLFKGNRIINHLSKCALDYCCLTAQNIFYERWEGGIPVSPSCNANCLGCISEQPAECCPSPQNRISFNPTIEEIKEVGINHLQIAPDGIISFGQGCEGEPSLAADNIAKAVKDIRSVTKRGTININTNAGYTEGIKKISAAGLDSIRVSLISVDENKYNAYYRPRNYSFQDVIKSIKYAKSNKVLVSLNLLVYPGLNDSLEEVSLLVNFIKENCVDMIQLRNLNIDPDYFEQKMPLSIEGLLGVSGMIKYLKKHVPDTVIGNFSRPIKK